MENELARFVDALPGPVFTAPSDGRFDLVRSVLEDLPVLSALTDASGRLELPHRQLVDETARNGHRPFSESIDHRQPSRPALGRLE